MAPPIVYDGLRLFLGALSPTPRGVDRVDLSYARFLFEDWPSECYGLLPTPWGNRLYDRDRALRLLATVQASWREQQGADLDIASAHLRDWLTGTVVSRQLDPKPRLQGALGRGLRLLKDNGVHWGRSVIRAAPKHAVYLNIGQVGWASLFVTQWLRHRPDIKPIFMLHDVIPLQHPDLVSGGGRLSQNWMLRTVLRKAAGLITTTHAASDTVMATLRQHGLPIIPVRSLPLPVAEVFLQRDPPDEELRRHPYFLVCGAIEPRKNHLLLLKVWRGLVQRIGQNAPRLVMVGSPAHQGEQIVRQFREALDLRNHVTVVSGMGSPGLRVAMANAQAVLMPSLAEGFGLPVIEALAVGTPVLASDLMAHREIGGGLAIYLDPTDDVAWLDAIMNIIENTLETNALRQRIAQYRPFTAARYFRLVSDFLTEFA
jgi:glycosyltransferase involved in cell wall biosynthesis